MTWRIIGTFSAISFFGVGLTVLSNPDCLSASFGGSRVVQITCRPDEYGSMSGTSAGILAIIVGSFFLFISWSYLFSRTFQSEPKTFSSRGSASVRMGKKVCKFCSFEMPQNYGHCPKCMGTKFVSLVLPTNVDTPPKVNNSANNSNTQFKSNSAGQIGDGNVPEFKVCPYCAEDVKFAAIKCRYCGSEIK